MTVFRKIESMSRFIQICTCDALQQKVVSDLQTLEANKYKIFEEDNKLAQPRFGYGLFYNQGTSSKIT